MSCVVYDVIGIIYGNLFVSTGKRAAGKRKMEPGKGKKMVDNGKTGNVKGKCIVYVCFIQCRQ